MPRSKTVITDEPAPEDVVYADEASDTAAVKGAAIGTLTVILLATGIPVANAEYEVHPLQGATLVDAPPADPGSADLAVTQLVAPTLDVGAPVETPQVTLADPVPQATISVVAPTEQPPIVVEPAAATATPETAQATAPDVQPANVSPQVTDAATTSTTPQPAELLPETPGVTTVAMPDPSPTQPPMTATVVAEAAQEVIEQPVDEGADLVSGIVDGHAKADSAIASRAGSALGSGGATQLTKSQAGSQLSRNGKRALRWKPSARNLGRGSTALGGALEYRETHDLGRTVTKTYFTTSLAGSGSELAVVTCVALAAPSAGAVPALCALTAGVAGVVVGVSASVGYDHLDPRK